MRPVIALVTALALSLASVVPVPAGAEPRPVAPAGQSTPVMVVLDASGSMNTADAPGPRISAAKQAVYDLVDALPAGAQVGLEVYGTGTDSSAASKAAGCRDIKQVVPVGAVHKAAFKAAVAGIKARGYTPIGAALKAAAAKLPAAGPRSIVLVSDGEDTCAPPRPCDVAKQLNSAGTELTVHTIGFKVDKAARGQLSCIAAATGGSYRETNQGGELARILVNRVGTALRAYNAVGTPISGARNPIGAPQVKPGQYVDTFFTSDAKNPDNDAVQKYYTIDVAAGETAYVSVTIAVPPLLTKSTSVGAKVELYTPDGRLCASAYHSNIVQAGRLLPSTTLLSQTFGDRARMLCDRSAGQFVVAITRIGDAFPTQGIRSEIDLHVEPIADASGLPAAQTTALADISPAANGKPKTIDGGSSFDNAPLLSSGTYTDTVVSGELRFYRVHLDWGQRLAYRIGLPATTQSSFSSSVEMQTGVISPVRQSLDTTGSDIAFYRGADAALMHAATAYTARYTNRASTNSEAQRYSVDGDYYIAYWSTYTDQAPALPLTMTIQVIGNKERGPVYGRQGPPIPVPSSAARPSASGKSSPAAAAPAASSDGITAWVWALIAAALVGVAVAVLLLLRRRQGSSAGPEHTA